MNQIISEHPNDEELMEFALMGEETDLNEHIDTCPSCSRYVKEIETLQKVLTDLPEENVPSQLRSSIMKNLKGKRGIIGDWYKFDIATWYKNPFILGIGIV